MHSRIESLRITCYNRGMITIDDFSKVEIKIGTVLSATKIPEGDRLLKLIFDFGDEQRQIMSAIAPFYPDPTVLIGKQIAVCTNLEPKKFKGYESQGMIMAMDSLNGGIVLLSPEEQVPPGTKIH
jgi:methionine--tRNA ligase beta chain